MHDLGDGLQEQDEKTGPSKGSFEQGILTQNGLTFQGVWGFDWYNFLAHPEMQNGLATH